jgi:hypothetical protein
MFYNAVMFIVHIWWWLQRLFGASNTSGVAYGFWSGSVSDISEVALFGALIGLYRHHNCTVKGCPRIGHHKVEGTNYKTCHRHATVSHHKKLQQDHKDKFPKQHELLGKK